LSDEDLDLACKKLRTIEKDLAFEVVESYQSRRMEDFADALLTLQALVQTVGSLCESSKKGANQAKPSPKALGFEPKVRCAPPAHLSHETVGNSHNQLGFEREVRVAAPAPNF
jgi:hypothetical protein